MVKELLKSVNINHKYRKKRWRSFLVHMDMVLLIWDAIEALLVLFA